jgi:hypothetical protein
VTSLSLIILIAGTILSSKALPTIPFIAYLIAGFIQMNSYTDGGCKISLKRR